MGSHRFRGSNSKLEGFGFEAINRELAGRAIQARFDNLFFRMKNVAWKLGRDCDLGWVLHVFSCSSPTTNKPSLNCLGKSKQDHCRN